MKFYSLDTVFNFGKYNGFSLEEIMETNPGYIDWCIINLDHFVISDGALKGIESAFPGFSLSKEATEKQNEKMQMASEENMEVSNESYEDEDDPYDYHDSYYDDCSPSNNPYYNDALDMDQQSPEFWDSF